MIDSLKKKLRILEDIDTLNMEQVDILNAEDFNEDAFEENMHDKGDKIEQLERLDSGFQSLFDKIKDELGDNKEAYKEQISELKSYIKSITDMSSKIEVQEKRNKVLVERKFSEIRRNLKTAKRSTSMAKQYYQNMNKIETTPQFMDHKQ